MTAFSEKNYFIKVAIIHRFMISLLIMSPNITMEQKAKRYKGIRATEAFEIQGTFSDKVTPDINEFTDEPVVKCGAQVVTNT